MPKEPSANPFDHAQALVIRFDPDRHYAALFAPADRRAYLYALHAFALEIGGVRAAVKEPMPGEIRLQWWRDVLNGGREEEAGGHPIAVALQRTIADNRLPVQPLLDLIDARTFDLYNDPMPDWSTLEGYCGETQSALVRLDSIILSRGNDPGGAEAAGHAGVALALTGLLRAFPWHSRRGQTYVPKALLDAVGVDREDIVAGCDSEGLRAALAEMRSRARSHLQNARALKADLPAAINSAFLPLAMVDRYLKPMDGKHFKPFETLVESANWLRIWSMWRGW